MAKFSKGLRNAMLNSGSLISLLEDRVMRIYEGSDIPLTADAAALTAGNNWLMEITADNEDGTGLSLRFEHSPQDVALQRPVDEVWKTASILASGKMAFFRIEHRSDDGSDSPNGDSMRIQGTIGLGPGSDMIVSNLYVTAGQPWTLNYFRLTLPTN